MATEFRSSLFGFNRDDVMNYIRKKDAEFKSDISDKNSKIKKQETELASLKADLDEALKNIESLSEQNAKMSAELKDYKAREDEIESLARKIGKLYLVSKSSAKSIVDRAEESAEIISEQTKTQLANIESTEQSLQDLARRIVSTSEKYVSDLNSASRSLSEAKDTLSGKEAERIRISSEFSEIYEKLG